MTAKTVIDVILGEAKAGSFEDMLAIASVISNRANGGQTSWEDVVQRTSEFNAYNKPLPSGVNKYRADAQRAIDQVKKSGPVHNATFYATPKAQGNLPKGLSKVTSTDGHIYFTDPQKRPIYTASGLKTIDYSALSEPNANMASALPTGADIPIPQATQQITAANAPAPTMASTAPPMMYTPGVSTSNAAAPFEALLNGAPKGLAALTQKTDQANFEAPRNEFKTDGLLGYLTADKGPSHVEGLDADYKSRLEPFLRHNGDTKIFSGFRSNEHQSRLFDAAVKKYGSPQAARKWVAPPGKSNHNAKAGEGGKATDLRYGSAEAREKAHREAESFGLTFRMGHEPWHIEPIKDWDRQVNPEYGLTPENPPVPADRTQSQALSAPEYQPKAADYENYTMSAPQQASMGEPPMLPSGLRGAPSGNQERVDDPIIESGYFSDYYADKEKPAIPEYKPKASDYANYGINARSDLPTMAVPDIEQIPDAIATVEPVDAANAFPEAPAPYDAAKGKKGSSIIGAIPEIAKNTAKRMGASAIGGAIAGPIGALVAPPIAQLINQQLFNGKGPFFGQNPFNAARIPKAPINRFQSQGNNSSNRMQNAMTGPRGATNTASNGSTATSLGNGQYEYYSPMSGKTSIKGEIDMNQSADLTSFFSGKD
tara:strand:+ start:11936 stop:13900 length:1965 start_codon:yes stop_codon:yes gene_type:complete